MSGLRTFQMRPNNDRQIVGMHLTQDWDRIDGTGYMVYTVEAVSEGKVAA